MLYTAFKVFMLSWIAAIFSSQTYAFRYFCQLIVPFSSSVSLFTPFVSSISFYFIFIAKHPHSELPAKLFRLLVSSPVSLVYFCFRAKWYLPLLLHFFILSSCSWAISSLRILTTSLPTTSFTHSLTACYKNSPCKLFSSFRKPEASFFIPITIFLFFNLDHNNFSNGMPFSSRISLIGKNSLFPRFLIFFEKKKNVPCNIRCTLSLISK